MAPTKKSSKSRDLYGCLFKARTYSEVKGAEERSTYEWCDCCPDNPTSTSTMKVILGVVSMDGWPCGNGGLLGIGQSLSSAVAHIHAHGCFIVNMFLFNTLLCIGNRPHVCDDYMMYRAIHVLPQVHCWFHVDEAGVFAELPVHVVGDPSLPVIGIDHFPGRKDGEGDGCNW